MADNITNILDMYHGQILELFGTRLTRIVLYGSYARGDFTVDSDMDIMILADIEPDEVSRYSDKVFDLTYDFEQKYGLEINPCIQSNTTFNQWKNVYPFFMNIEKEGIAI